MRRHGLHHDDGIHLDVRIQNFLITEVFKELFPDYSLERVCPVSESRQIDYKGLQS